ncbi:MAG: hypothetical protein NTV50_02300 [Planctomycetota bacterium]|nr:hypothetical protein [Planctomycetota bacterium]
MSNTHNPTSNLHLTRKQLDDLDVLVQKMLNLPEANLPREAPQKAEPDFSSMGIFSPGEAPWTPKPIEPSTTPYATSPVIAQSPKEEYIPAAPQPILNRYPQSALGSSPKIEEVQAEPQAPSEPTSGWKPSPLTWAPLAQSWEKLRQEELEKQQKEIKPSIIQPIEKPIEIPKPILLESKQDFGTNKGSTPLNYSTNSEPTERKKRSKLKTVLLDAVGFLGIILFVCAAALYLSSSFGWPMK